MRLGCLLPLLVFTGCDGGSAAFDAGVPDAGHQPSATLKACAASPAGVDSIAQAVERLNALPPPVDNACFIASLARPLQLVASRSMFSAQPAPDAVDPRIFVLSPQLVLSVAPAGDGAALLELGQWYTPTRTLKGEVALPAAQPLAPDAPLTRVAQSNGTTTCGLCHRSEVADPLADGGYVSDAYRPNPGEEVKLPGLAAIHQACVDSSEASARCELFHALFDFGEVKQGAFSPDVALFVQ